MSSFDKPYPLGDKQMPEGMREFLPHTEKHARASSILFEQYGEPPLEVAKAFFSAKYDPQGVYEDGNLHVDEISDYLYEEIAPLLVEHGFYRYPTRDEVDTSIQRHLEDPENNIDLDDSVLVTTNKTRLFRQAIEGQGALDLLRFEVQHHQEDSRWTDSEGTCDKSAHTAEKIKFIYATAEYIGNMQEKRREFEANRQESVLSPGYPLYDESFFSDGR